MAIDRRLGAVAAALLLSLVGCAEHFADSLAGQSTPGTTGTDATASDGPATEPRSAPAGALQQAVMDFSDRFVTAAWGALDRYIAEEPDVSRQVAAQRLKISLATSSMTIAASKDPRANLLDMAVFISAGRWAVDTYWIPKVLGEKAADLGSVFADMDREIQTEVRGTLTAAQAADLNSLIAEWKAGNPDPREAANVRLRSLDGVVLKHFQESTSARGLLSNVRKWLGNVNQSLLYGERMMFYLERTPLILSQQADLTVDHVAERFPIATINPDFQRWSDLANSLPEQITTVFRDSQQSLTAALPGINTSLENLTKISASLHGTVASADSLATKIGQLPYGPDDYAAALAGTAASLEKIHDIVRTIDRLTAQETGNDGQSRAAQLARLLDERTDRLIDTLFLRAAALIGMFIGGLLLVVILARILFRRARPAKS